MSKIRLKPQTKKKLAAFDALQLVPSGPIALVYHNPDRPLWIDLNGSKKLGFGTVAFHTTENVLHKAKWSFSTFM